MSKDDANAVQMCGKHGKCRIYSHIYKPYMLNIHMRSSLTVT